MKQVQDIRNHRNNDDSPRPTVKRLNSSFRLLDIQMDLPSLVQGLPEYFLQTTSKGRVQKKRKKKLEFSNRGGRGSENKKKFQLFQKQCHST